MQVRSPHIGASMVFLGSSGLIAVVAALVWTHLGQRADERGRWSVGVPWRTNRILTEWLGLVSVEFILVALAVAVGVALLRRRVARAAGATLLVVGANVSTQLLKAGIPRPFYGIGTENTLPSGHVTVVTSLVLATLLVAPSRLRSLVALLAAGAGTLTGAATIIQRWHRPSDVIAAFGVCAVWTGLAFVVADRGHAIQGRSLGDLTRRTLRAYGVPALVGAALAGSFLVVAGMATQGEASNVLVGGFVLSAFGVVCAGVVSFTGAGLEASAGHEGLGKRRAGAARGAEGEHPKLTR